MYLPTFFLHVASESFTSVILRVCKESLWYSTIIELGTVQQCLFIVYISLWACQCVFALRGGKHEWVESKSSGYHTLCECRQRTMQHGDSLYGGLLKFSCIIGPPHQQNTRARYFYSLIWLCCLSRYEICWSACLMKVFKNCIFGNSNRLFPSTIKRNTLLLFLYVNLFQ